MDTTCAAVVGETYITFQNLNIVSMEGLQYFDGLDSLQSLFCQINYIPRLPTSLKRLTCHGNFLVNLPNLPNGLKVLQTGDNKLTYLPNLPNSLQILICVQNRLRSLPELPAVLKQLAFSNNMISYLQDLPIGLTEFVCDNNYLTTLPSLPITLNAVVCNNNPITCIPYLPPNANFFNIDNTYVTCLPNHPVNLNSTLPLCQANNPNNCPNPARIYGNVQKATNCTATTENLPNILVSATNTATNEIYVGNTNASGGYEIAVPLGVYTLSIVPPNAYWSGCTNTVTINITQQAQQESRNVLLNAVAACADMSITHTDAAVMRPCSTSVYRVSYFNAGTIAAAGAYAEMTLAPEQTFASASLPSVALGGGRYRFQLPSVAPLERGGFDINVNVACSAAMGQQLCTDIEVLPHTFCNPPALWDGSDVEVSGRCIGNNQVRFILTNTGAGAMNAPQTYAIIEDNLMIRSGQIQLSVAGSDSVTIAADPLRIYRIVVNESPYNPAGNTQETVLVWGCNGLSQNMHWGAVNQYPLNSGADYIHRLCTTVRTSFDPNDISAVPSGVGTQNFIANNTLLEYKIRFQNTGNDTAFVVRLLNPLPSNLDLTTLKIGAGSHPFTYSLKADGVLEFLFQNIRLEDSTSNEPKSHGFVTYSILPKANLAAGTIINNQAHIYFDTNLPVATNIYTHTIGAVLVGTSSIFDNKNIAIKVMPNPMHDAAVFEITDDPQTDFKAELVLYNALGQRVLSQNFVGNRLLLARNNLPQGYYFYTINTTNGLLTKGKLVVN